VQRSGAAIPQGAVAMLDLIFVVATISCFVAAFAYAQACERV
jgi:hypothetical protein